MIRNNSVFNCKVVLLGEQAVGKSSLALRFVENKFMQFHIPTIGAAFLTKMLTLKDCMIKFEVWDTAGQERFNSIAPMYYRGAKAAIVVYDITKSETFVRAQKWVDELRLQGDSKIIIILAGNKSDLEMARQVQKQKAATYAAETNLYFLETSAKSNKNVDEIFYEIGKRYPKKNTLPPIRDTVTPTITTSQQSQCCNSKF